GYHGFPANMVLAGDDKFITVGGFWIDGASKEYFYVRRYNGNGTVDLSFGTGGAVATDMGETGSAADAAIQNDGKIVLAGLCLPFGTNEDFGVVRYNVDG